MRSGATAYLLMTCLALTACSDPLDANAPVVNERADAEGGPCISYYADSDEVADRGRLVQLDFSLRVTATRSARAGGASGSDVLPSLGPAGAGKFGFGWGSKSGDELCWRDVSER